MRGGRGLGASRAGGWRSSPYDGRILFTKAETAPGKKVAARLAVVLLLLILVVTMFWLDRAGLHDERDGAVSFGDVIYFTMVTITTVGYGDIVPVTDRARLLDALFVTPIRMFIFLVFLGTAYEMVVQKTLEGYRMTRLQRRLKDHVVICGYGHAGRVAARELVEKGMAADEIVVVDPSEEAVREAADEGFVGLRGDASREQVVLQSGIERARAAVVCTGRDDTNVLIVLTIRNVNPKVRIIASVDKDENFALVKQSGADSIVSLPKIGGYLLADAILYRYASDYFCDLVTEAGEVRFAERPARDEEVGRSPRDVAGGLVVRIQRGSQQIGFWESEAVRIEAGDVLLIIEPTKLPSPAEPRRARD